MVKLIGLFSESLHSICRDLLVSSVLFPEEVSLLVLLGANGRFL